MVWLFFVPMIFSSSPKFSEAANVGGSVYHHQHTFKVKRNSWNTPETESNMQFANAIDLMYGTLFQELDFLDSVNLTKFKDEVYEQSLLLRRLYLVLGLGDLQYKPTESESPTSPWPFPFGVILAQGQRVSIILDDIMPDEFLNFLTANNPKLFYKRRYSSHGAEFDDSTKTIKEIKIKSPFRRLRSTENTLGADFPFGGVGAPLPDGNQVGPRGIEINGSKLLKKRQIGHLHIYTRYFPEERKALILLGFEGCAPGTSNQLGCTHNLFSGIRNQKRNPSVSGGTKWAKMNLSIPSPAEYGGKFIFMSRDTFEHIKQRVRTILSLPEFDQQRLFKKLLPMEGFQVTGFLWTYDEWIHA